MPDLIRLQTPEFEFTVWSNDINRRSLVYRDTIAKRTIFYATKGCNTEVNHSTETAQTSDCMGPTGHGNKEVGCHVLRFSPEIAISNACKTEGLGFRCFDHNPLCWNEPLINDATVQEYTKHEKLILEKPVFFENTQYQFEWLFFVTVSNAWLTHRSQSVNAAFRFTPESKTARGVVPARLTGTIDTGNDVGWLRLPLVFEINGKTHFQHISFEVLPTKIAMHQDLPMMYKTIDKVYPLWRFSLVEKTEQEAARNRVSGNFPLMWLSNFAILRERFVQSLKVICAAPHSRLQMKADNIKAIKLRGRLRYKLAEKVRQDITAGQFDNHYVVKTKQLSINTPENRFIKMVVSKSKRQLLDFELKLRKSNQAPERQRLSDSFLSEIHSWQQPLQELLGQSFLKDIDVHRGIGPASLVLQQKTGYSAVYRVWQELKLYLDLFGNQASISTKSVAEIYEIWCFISLKQILEDDLGFELIEDSGQKLSTNDFFEYQLKDGFAGAFRFKRVDGITARLAHEPKFTRVGKLIRSYSVNQEPDIVLEVTLPKTEYADRGSAPETQFIWVFDAKYRVKAEKNRFDDKIEDIDGIDYVPDDAINQMHRYRDALIRLSKPHLTEAAPNLKLDEPDTKSRAVFGAFALYPGFFDQGTMQNPYAASIEEVGIGAFALLPSEASSGYCGHRWLLEFLQTQIGPDPDKETWEVAETVPSITELAERVYVQEPARIPYHGMRQVLYTDLTLIAEPCDHSSQDFHFIQNLKGCTRKCYRIPQECFLEHAGSHIIKEIRYLTVPTVSTEDDVTKKIEKVWPVVDVRLLPSKGLTAEQVGNGSETDEMFFVFVEITTESCV